MRRVSFFLCPVTRFPGVSRRSALARSARSVRIPALTVSNSGTVIATMDARVDGSYDLDGGTNNIQIAIARSTDGGTAFTHPKIIAKAPHRLRGLRRGGRVGL